METFQATKQVKLIRLWVSKQQSETGTAFKKTGFGNLTGAK